MSDPSVEVKDIERAIHEKPILIFGKDIREIKCFRKSFIYGIYFGFAGGLATFLFTSRASVSANVAFASLWLGVFGYWVPCRFKYENSKLKMEAFQKRLKKRKEEEMRNNTKETEGS